MKTEYIKAKDLDKKWYLIDADSQTLGSAFNKSFSFIKR